MTDIEALEHILLLARAAPPSMTQFEAQNRIAAKRRVMAMIRSLGDKQFSTPASFQCRCHEEGTDKAQPDSGTAAAVQTAEGAVQEGQGRLSPQTEGGSW